jgi:hypothetical protein
MYTERIFGPDLINVTGLYTKVRPHIHLSLNKSETKNEHKMEKKQQIIIDTTGLRQK